MRVLEFCVEAKSEKEIREFLKLSSRNYVRENVIKLLIIDGKIKLYQ